MTTMDSKLGAMECCRKQQELYRQAGDYKSAFQESDRGFDILRGISVQKNGFNEAAYRREYGEHAFCRGELLLELGSFGLARVAFAAASESFGIAGCSEFKAAIGVAKALVGEGDYQFAVDTIYGEREDDAESSLHYAGSKLTLGDALRGLGQYLESISEYRIAGEIFQQVGDGTGLQQYHLNLATVYFALGNLSQSIVEVRKGLEVQQLPCRNFYPTLATKAKLGRLLTDAGQLQEAESLLVEATIGLAKMQNRLGGLTEFWITMLELHEMAYLDLQRCLVHGGKPKEALVWAERGRSRALLYELTRVSSSEMLETMLPFDEMSYEEAWNVLKDQSEATNAVIVEYTLVSKTELLIWVVDAEKQSPRCESVDVGQWLNSNGYGEKDLYQVIQELRERIATNCIEWEPKRCWDTEEDLRNLHVLLFGNISCCLIPNRTVVLVPHKVLYMVPFAAVQDAQQASGQRFLFQRHVISVLPSILVLKECLKMARVLDHQVVDAAPALVLGNPITKNLAELPGAEVEADRICSILGRKNTVKLLREKATKEATLKELQLASFAHLALHIYSGYSWDHETGALVLSWPPESERIVIYNGIQKGQTNPGTGQPFNLDDMDGIVSAKEIARLKLRASIVVLSGCRSGLGQVTAEGLLGFGRSFFIANVPCTITTLWELDDKITLKFMEGFYKCLVKGEDVAHALQTSMALIAAIPNYNIEHWAAFVPFGLPTVCLPRQFIQKQKVSWWKAAGILSVAFLGFYLFSRKSQPKARIQHLESDD